MSKKALWIDVEITGLNSSEHGLTEVACLVEIDGIVIDSLSLKINTTSYKKDIIMTPKALELTNKSEDEIKNYPISQLQFKKFIEFIENYVDPKEKYDVFQPIGYNINFDMDFIKAWFKDNRHDNYSDYFSYKDVDIFALVKVLKYLGYINTKNDKLSTLCEEFYITLDAHNALNDIEATKELYEVLIENFIRE